ncbi:class I alpha-mannosidase [Cordyceps militaris]|uniref:alpha-1,2-Mannosidase n=1 Tax=Cordyceps militaris TaxID=73501 RepID=A0A2H4SA50_CORMI|nr:class I alpha-mannosidase [Cordyceps militaris]
MLPSPRRYVRSIVGGLTLFGIIYYVLATVPQTRGPAPHPSLERFMNEGPAPPIVFKKSSFDWSQVQHTYLPPDEVTPLPADQARALPSVQHIFGPEAPQAARVREKRRAAVRRVFHDDWHNYKKFAWKMDALNPKSGTAKNQFSGWMATLVDGLDALWMLGLKDEFEEALAVVAELDFGKSTDARVNIFETTIRYLGGILAAYDLSKREALLKKAVELGDMLYSAFDTKHLFPVDFMQFESGKLGKGLSLEAWVVSASPGTLSLEMTRLSQVTGDPKYYDVTNRLMELFRDQQNATRIPGLWPVWISLADRDTKSREEFTLGGSADSLYEYLPKMHALLGGGNPMYADMTKDFLAAAKKELFFRPMLPGGEDVLLSGNAKATASGETTFDPESEHLTCFIGGTVALAGKLLVSPEDVAVGGKLARGCAHVYHAFASGVMPERFNTVPCEPRLADTCPWDEKRWEEGIETRREYKDTLPKGFTTAKDPRYLLRPEAIESLFLLYRMTGDTEYQESAWKMFESIEKHSRTTHGHAAILDVVTVYDEGSRQQNLDDYMESFWFGETLKYFYLIFSPPDLITSPAKQTTPSSSTMALDKVLTPDFLKSVRDFWYEHLPSDDDLVIPGQVAHQRWYAGGAEFDKACLTQFEPALDAIQASGLDGAGLLRLARPTTPCSWLGLVLLLDQMPRNCYRGAAARVVFSVFDPLALAVAQAAVAAGVPHEAPEMRWQLAFRTWFYLPYEHTEDAAMHDECRRQCEGLARDVEALLAEEEEDEGADAYRRRAWRVVHRDPKAARALVQAQLDFARRHEDIIKQFGRYPHRNEALGRESTAEEKAFLEGGGDTFQSK